MAITVEGKYALITGGGGGINLAFTRLLLSKGCSVIIGDLKLTPEAESLLKEYPHPSLKGKPSVVFHQTNVASWAQLSSFWKAGLEAFPTIDIVVPGAGVYDPPSSDFWRPPRTETNPDSESKDLADADPGTYAVLNINLTHPIRLSQLAIGYWTQNKRPGTLVHLSSVAGHLPRAGSPLYIASKHGLHGFVRSLGMLRDPLGIRIGAVAPGPALTGIWDGDENRRDKVLMDAKFISVEDIVSAMWELVVNEEMGNGTILEVVVGSTRVLPIFNMTPPAPESLQIPGLFTFYGGVLADIKANGLPV
ncbi:15-hydroxyprostaglandin dehydrogenase-like protein [Cladobotryum mycophilum]|uniref:15-hydroxyprostaglandin dehydrogenase-like protein n=1 Tax=Cladobotryum mycophilum TaxID=491253 RepID=A0ABR0SQ86_9HYPO